jgi:hypothetical protein
MDVTVVPRRLEAGVKEFSQLSNDELDTLLLAEAKGRWQKVAMVIAHAMTPYAAWDEERVGSRIVALVDTGWLEGAGDLRNWRFSEVRLHSPTSLAELKQILRKTD